jgi:hypothetical protein
VWRLALDEARRGRPVSLDRLAEGHDTETGTRPGSDGLVPVVDRDIELVGARRLADLVADLLAGTGLSYDDVRGYLYPKLARRGYADETLRADGGSDTISRRQREDAEHKLLALVARPGESLTRHRAVLRERVRETLFDETGRFRPTEERRRRWEEHRRANMAG